MQCESVRPRRLALSRWTLCLAMFLVASAVVSQEIGVMQFPEGEVQHVVRLDSTEWQRCPLNQPADCQMAVLDGDPRSDDLFTVRFRTNDGLVVPPHWHPKDERVTVIEGSVAVAFGADSQREDAVEFGPGDYYVNARHAVHTVWMDGSTVLQVTGIGPWKIVPLTESPPPSSR